MAATTLTKDFQYEDSDRVINFLGKVAFYLVIAALGFMFAFPFLWALSTSLKPTAQLYIVPPPFFPSPVTFDAWRDVWSHVPLLRYIVNSSIVTVLSLVGQLISCSLAAYGFARLRFRGRDFLFMLVLSVLMLPLIVTLIPNYILFRQLNWLNTFLPLIVPNWLAVGSLSAVTIFLLRQYFKGIPYDLDEAAKIDGANYFVIFLRVIVPLSRPVLSALFALNFTHHWNRFLEPLIYLQSPDNLTLPVGLRILQNVTTGSAQAQVPTDNLLMAGSLIAVLPALVLYLIAQRQLMAITISGSKG